METEEEEARRAAKSWKEDEDRRRVREQPGASSQDADVRVEVESDNDKAEGGEDCVVNGKKISRFEVQRSLENQCCQQQLKWMLIFLYT